jgi:hypothetical protein
MGRITKITLWIAALILGSYYVLVFYNCSMDAACHPYRKCPSERGVTLPQSYSCGEQKAD